MRIKEDEWPIVGEGHWHNSRNGIDRDATRWADMHVRRHADGRVLVYATFQTRWIGEENRAAGQLLAQPSEEQLTQAICRVAEDVGVAELAQRTLRSLEPEQI